MKRTQNTFNRNAVALQAAEAKLALNTILQKAQSGEYDDEAPLVIAIDFEQVLYKLCLAWHFKRLSDQEIEALPEDEFIRLSNTVPNFGFSLRLLSGIDLQADSGSEEK
jgi:hypothetical protein